MSSVINISSTAHVSTSHNRKGSERLMIVLHAVANMFPGGIGETKDMRI